MISKHEFRAGVLLALLLGAGARSAPAQMAASTESTAQAAATEYEGAAALGLAVRQLGTTKRVLMIGAHPDDESTQILSTLALGQGAEVAYLSLTRGEGGQNGIGPELQEGLGLIRTEELLAARRVDGARQFFSRAYDFGFSKSADEAFRHWPRDSLVADAVATIREFRPDVVISIFSGTPRDGHGQHQAAGIVAREAFAAAGDPARFPRQLRAGLQPFAPAKLYQALWGRDEQAGLELNTGALDPLLGRSFYQVAMASRSRHRSQDMGRALEAGPQASSLRLLASRTAGAAAADASLFEGVDTTLAARARHLTPAAGLRSNVADSVVALLADYDARVLRLRAAFNPLRPGDLAPELAGALGELRRARSRLGPARTGAAAELRFVLAAEQAQAELALARAARLVFDAVAGAEQAVPGDTLQVETSLWNGGDREIVVRELAPALPPGWQATPLDPLPATVPPGTLVRRRFRVRVPRDAAISEPYFLRRPRQGDLYSWPADESLAGRPIDPAAVRAVARVEIADAPVALEQDATARVVDPRQGESRRPVRVVPAVSVALDPAVAVLPLSASGAAAPLRFVARLTAYAADGRSGTLRLRLPPGWTATAPVEVPLRFAAAGDSRTAEFEVRPPANSRAGEYDIGAVFETAEGERFERAVELIDYPHIRPRLLLHPARAAVKAFPVQVPAGVRVAYVPGAGDGVPDALAQLGVRAATLDPAALASAKLAAFDVIITGIRAYEVRPDLAAANRRLLDWVRAGGTLIVQYNKYEFADADVAPFPVGMARPHDRVTDETAPVRLLRPAHALFTTPNRITSADFDGWVQERGLYFLHEWDPRYTPLLEMADPGEPPLRGGLLVAPLGKGTYVYTGLSLFRQLPAGVPGAYRLLANLIAL